MHALTRWSRPTILYYENNAFAIRYCLTLTQLSPNLSFGYGLSYFTTNDNAHLMLSVFLIPLKLFAFLYSHDNHPF